MALQSEVSPPIVGDPNKDTQIEGETKSDDNESCQSSEDTVDLEEGEILDSGAEEEEEKDFSKSSLKDVLDKSLLQNIEQLANHQGNAKSDGSPDRKAASSRKQKKMAANYMDPDRIDDSEQEDGWFPGSPKYKSKYNDKPVDYRMELEAYRGTPPSSPDRKRRDEKSRKKRSSKKSKKTRKTIRRKDIKGVRVAKYKKDAARGRICKFFKEGKCAKGSDCMYSHVAPIPFKKKELCKFYLNGHCNKGKDCLYMHSEFPCKFYHTGSECYAKDDCRFSHAPLTDEMKRVLHDYLRISHGDDVRLRCDDDRDEERTGNDRERDRDRDRDRKRRRSCSPEQPRGIPPKRTCLLGSPPRHIREAEETKRWQEEMKMLQQQQPGFEICLSPNPEEGSSAHFKPNFYTETLLNTPSPKKRPPNPEIPNSFHGNSSNNYPRESPSKVYIYDDDEFIEIDLPPPPPAKQEPPEEFHWDNVRSMTQHEENHIKPFHENSHQELDFTSDVKFDETTQFSEMESSTDCPPNLSPNQTSAHEFKDSDEVSNQGPAKIKEEKFSDEENNASSQEAPAPPIVIPSHLPPKQRELLKRVLHNNQKKKTASDAPGSPTEGTDIEIKKEESDAEVKVESQPKDYEWYSSEEDDDDDDTVQPLTAVLKRIQQDPPSKPIVQETKPSLKLLDMFEHIQRKGKNLESSNGQAQQQKQSQNQFWVNLFGGDPLSLPLPVTNSNNPPPSEPKRRTLLPDPILPPVKVEPVASKESVEIKDPRLKNRDPRKLANMPVPAPKIATFDPKNDPVSAPSALAQNAIPVKPIPAVSSDSSKESIPYKLRGISAKPPNYTPLIHASQSNPSLLKDPRLRKHLNPNANSDVIGNGKDSVIASAKPPVQSKSIPPIPELLLKYEPLKAINIFETSSKSTVKAEEPKPPVVYDPRRLRRDSRSNSGSNTPPHLTIVDSVPEEKPAPILENEKEFVEEKKWLPPVLERNWAPPVLEKNWASIVEKPEIKTEIDVDQPLNMESSGKSPPKKSPSSPPSTKDEFITVIKEEPSPVATSNTHPIVPPLIIKKVKPTPPASHLPRAIADPRMARLHNRNSRPLVSSDVNSKSIVERKKVTTPTEPPKMTVNAAADSSKCSEMSESVNPTESPNVNAEEASDKASKEEKSKSAKSIPKKRRLSDKSDEKKKNVHRNRKSSMDYASPLNSCDASKDSKSLGYNSYNQRPKRTAPPHNERMSPNSGVSSSVMEMSDNSMPEFVLSDSSNLECDNSSDVNLRDRFKTIDPTASPFC